MFFNIFLYLYEYNITKLTQALFVSLIYSFNCNFLSHTHVFHNYKPIIRCYYYL